MRLKTRLLGCVLFALLLTTGVSSSQEEGDEFARALVEKADRVRFPAEGFQVDAAINTYTNAGEVESREFQVLSKGNENTIVRVVEPASERGQMMLMKGRELWVFLPNVSQPVRLGLGQRLTGQVANGDLARANFAGGYKPTLLRTEEVDGEKCHVLDLRAVDRSVTYGRVLYWVRQSNNWPHKAEFYSLSGRLLKTARYQNFQSMAGGVRPARLLMEDALRKGEQSTLDYSGMQMRELPDKYFSKDFLKRLE